MKIYVVTSGEYSDYMIHGVTTKKEEAEAYVKAMREKEDSIYCPTEYYIEEYEDGAMGKWLNGYRIYGVRFNQEGNVVDTWTDSTGLDEGAWVSKRGGNSSGIGVRVFAKDGNQAIKIAAEKRVRFIHEQDLKALRGEE